MKWSIKSEKRSQSISLNILVPFFWMCLQTYRVSLLLLEPAILHMATLCLKKKKERKKKPLLYIIWSILSAALAGWKDSNAYSTMNSSSSCPFAPPCRWSIHSSAQSDQETRMLPVPHQQEAQLLLFLSQEVSAGSLLWLRCGQSFTVPVLEAWSSAWCFWGMDVEPFTGEASWEGWGWWRWS